jgi:sporulation protein YabP
MPYEQAQKTAKAVHTLSLENREKLSLGFDESLIVLTTAQGDLNIRGEELHIERIDLELGQLEVRGHIQELSYDEPKTARTLWSRLFG